MIGFLYLASVWVLLIFGYCYHSQQKFITFNTTSTKYQISTLISTNLDHEFSIYCPILINTKDSLAQFTVNQHKKKLVIQPRINDDSELLYNDYNQGEYWYGFKKSHDPTKKDITASFALVKVIVQQKTHDYFIPLFSLPLTFLSVSKLYKCDDVLISYRRTAKLSDVTVFSRKQSWTLEPQALWGFRNRDEDIFFSRQTYPLETQVHINVGQGKYCLLNQQVKPNTYNLEQKQIYELNDMLIKYSSTLQVRDKNEQIKKPQDL